MFTITRGAFSFIQAYMAESTSQGVAFDFRNEIFSKLQRLSFSYYDRNQTGQLMIRATDDVEKVRLFIAQGLVLAAQSVLLLVSSLIILFLSNAGALVVCRACERAWPVRDVPDGGGAAFGQVRHACRS